MAIARLPLGRSILNLLRRLKNSPSVAGRYRRVLNAFAAPDHLTFRSLPTSRAAVTGETLTVITANLWHDWPRGRLRLERLESFARLVEEEDAGLLFLQEVSRDGQLRADEWLAARLGMAFVYGQANGESQGNAFEEGVAVLSRYPLLEPSACFLAPRPLSLVRRLAVGVTVSAPGGDFLAVSAHLGHGRRLNTRQLNWLHQWVRERALDRPALIGGDFNTGENSPQMRRLRDSWQDLFRAANPDDEGITYNLNWPWGSPMLNQRLDYIFLQQGPLPWRVTEARTLLAQDLAHSDHHAVLARLVPDAEWPAFTHVDYVNGTTIAEISQPMLK